MGQFISSGTIYATHNWTSDLSYKLPFALQWIWPLPLFILVTLAPESPWFLIRQKRYDEAEQSIRQLSVEDETLDVKQTVAMMVSAVRVCWIWGLTRRSVPINKRRRSTRGPAIG
jgi:SP family general alpha glucoside:H+ symporter-like MFS transporter